MKTILVIEDTDYFRKSICKILKNAGYNVLEAENGIEAECMLANESVDLALIDIVMPEKGGIETLIDIHERRKDLKVLIMTGRVPSSSIAFRILVDQFGAYNILYKPFEKETLLSNVTELLAS